MPPASPAANPVPTVRPSNPPSDLASASEVALTGDTTTVGASFAPVRLSARARMAADQAIGFLMQQGVKHPHILSLAAGLVDPLTLPGDLVREACEAILGESGSARAALQYGAPAGAPDLIHELRRYFAGQEAASGNPVPVDAIDERRFVATTGSQQLLSILSETLLDPGDIVCVASPTYFAYLGILHGVGARIEAIPADRDGMRIDLLAERLNDLDRAGLAERVKLVYVVGDFENPSGACLSEARRRDLMRLVRERAARQHLFVLEDAAYRELRYDGTPLPSLWSLDPDQRHVIHAQTFSKCLSPGLRVGFGLLPESLVQPVFDRKGNEDFGSAHLNQRIVARLLGNGVVAQHAERVRAAYRVKRDAMLSALDEHLAGVDGVEWHRPDGGLYVWLNLPPGADTRFDSPLWKRAVEGERVMYVPGDICHGGPVETRARNQMRLSFGVQDASGIREGIARLARAIRAERG